MSEKQFPEGIRVSRHEKSPEWKVCELGIHVEQFYAWAKKHEKVSGYVNVDIKRSKGGKLYADLNDWTPEKKTEEPTSENVIDADNNIPF